jgi:hypothetical protein
MAAIEITLAAGRHSSFAYPSSHSLLDPIKGIVSIPSIPPHQFPPSFSILHESNTIPVELQPPPPLLPTAGLTPSMCRPLSPMVRTPWSSSPFSSTHGKLPLTGAASSASSGEPTALPCSGPWWTGSIAGPRARGHGSLPFAFRNNTKSNNSCSFP